MSLGLTLALGLRDDTDDSNSLGLLPLGFSLSIFVGVLLGRILVLGLRDSLGLLLGCPIRIFIGCC